MKKAIIFFALVALFGCKKNDPQPELFYDDRVQVGWYIGVDREQNRIYVDRPDTSLVRLTIYKNNVQLGYNCRRYPNSVGYEFPNSSKVVRFKATTFDGKLGYIIVGDTLEGMNFVKLF